MAIADVPPTNRAETAAAEAARHAGTTVRLAVIPVAVAHAAAEADRAAGAATPVDIGNKKGSLNWQWRAAWAG